MRCRCRCRRRTRNSFIPRMTPLARPVRFGLSLCACVFALLESLHVHLDSPRQTILPKPIHNLSIRLATLAARPLARQPRVLPPHALAHLHTPNLPLALGAHDLRPDRQQRRPHAPCRLPGFLVVARDAQADLAVYLEPAGWR